MCIIDIFDSWYSKRDKSRFLRRFYFYALRRRVITYLANSILRAYFNISSHKFKLKEDKNKFSGRLIVSLTSFPDRINEVWLTIESLLRQTYLPDYIILWLAEEQFKDKKIPRKLEVLKDRGLKIEFCNEDIRSHKKYYYALQMFPNDYIITVDDDVIYNTHLIENLVRQNDKYPGVICCNKASRIKTRENIILPYSEWESVLEEVAPTDSIMPIGVGGVMYPPHSLCSDVLRKDIFLEKCLLADDIWLNVMARLNKTLTSKTALNSSYLPIFRRKNVTLTALNISLGKNDIQLDALRTFFRKSIGIDPFGAILNNTDKV